MATRALRPPSVLVVDNVPGERDSGRAHTLRAYGYRVDHVLARIEAAPEQPGCPQHDQQRVAHAPRKPKRAKSTCACRRRVSRRRLPARAAAGRPAGPSFQLRVAAGIAGRPNLIEQAARPTAGIRGEARFDDRLVGIELGRHRRPRSVADRPSSRSQSRSPAESTGESCRG